MREVVPCPLTNKTLSTALNHYHLRGHMHGGSSAFHTSRSSSANERCRNGKTPEHEHDADYVMKPPAQRCQILAEHEQRERPIHRRFITPTTNITAISAQQQPTRSLPCSSPTYRPAVFLERRRAACGIFE